VKIDLKSILKSPTVKSLAKQALNVALTLAVAKLTKKKLP
jgi:hypothetical protein